MDMKDIYLKPWEDGFTLPETFNMASLLLDRHIENGRGGRIAIHYKDQKVTYQDMYQLANQTGNAFSKLGAQKGDRVLIMMYDSPDWISVFLGAMKIGAVPVPINILATASDVEYFITDSQATLLVIEEDLLSKIENLPRSKTNLKEIIVRGKAAGYSSLSDIRQGASTELAMFPTSALDHSYWLYTSGTTGQPKGVIHLHKDLVYAVENYGYHALSFTPDDVVYGIPRLFFSYGLNMILYLPFYYSASVVLDENRPVPEGVVANLQKYRPSVFIGVPTAYAQLLHYVNDNKLNPDFSHLRLCTSAGEALPGPIYDKCYKLLGVEILDGLGSSEVSWIYITNRPGKVRPPACGTVLPGYEVKLMNDDGVEVPRGQAGDLWVKSPTLAIGYWNKPDKTKDSFKDGWMMTGDCAVQDEDGYYFHHGRSNDTMKVSGIWVSPLEVEAALLAHDSVAQCAVVAKRDEQDLIKPQAFIVLKAGVAGDDALKKDLKNFVKERLAPYKYPRWIEFVGELPMTATGKIQRFKLRQD